MAVAEEAGGAGGPGVEADVVGAQDGENFGRDGADDGVVLALVDGWGDEVAFFADADYFEDLCGWRLVRAYSRS